MEEIKGKIISKEKDGRICRVTVLTPKGRTEAVLSGDPGMEIGEVIHFFYDKKASGIPAEIIPEWKKDRDGILRYLASGRVPELGQRGIAYLTRMDDKDIEALASGRATARVKELVRSSRNAARFAEYAEWQPAADRLYLKLKRKAPALTFAALYRGLCSHAARFPGGAGGREGRAKLTGSAEKRIKEDPYSFFGAAGLSFAETDELSLQLGALRTGEQRISSFIADMFANRGLKNSTCCPEDILTGCITEGLKISEASAAAYIEEKAESGKLRRVPCAGDEYLYTAAALAAERALADDIRHAAERKLSDKGVKAAVTALSASVEMSGADEAILRSVASKPLCTVISESPDEIADLIRLYASCQGVEARVESGRGYKAQALMSSRDGDAVGAAKLIRVVTDAEWLSTVEASALFRELGPKEKLVLISGDTDPAGVRGNVFSDIAASGLCPSFGREGAAADNVKYSLLGLFLQQDSGEPPLY